MTDAGRRTDAARTLAGALGAEEILIFVRDPLVGRSLPAPGFRQTLRDASSWHSLIERSVETGSAEGILRNDSGQEVPARAVGLPDGTAAVLLGISAQSSALELLEIMLPMFSALFRAEAAQFRAEVEVRMARQTSSQAANLAAKLDTTRADLQRALDVAEKATRARDEFLATVSHELRTPLTSIIGWIQLLQMEGDPASLAEGLETIDRNARAQSRLIEDILDFSRINAGKLRLDVRPTDLMDVINAAIEIVRPAADAKNVRIERVLDPHAADVSGDADRLQQVAWNLLSNAVKFTPRGGRIQVRLERVDSHCEITVSDTGEGIAPDFLPFVFDRFSQADSSSTRTHSGLGLGLGIVRHLVELHGGTVQAFSAGRGQGASFVVRLPLLIAGSRTLSAPVQRYVAAPSIPMDEAWADLTGVSILLVEDNDDSRKLLRTILTRAGAEVNAAEGAAIALKLLSENRPDILISDIEMPGEDGYSFIRKVRLQEVPGDHLPAIALTAYTRSIDRVRALAAGFQTHMSKPVEPAELLAAIKSLLAGGRRTP